MSETEPMLLLTPNRAALDLLDALLDEPVDPHGDIPCWETTINLRITQSDLQRYRYGNGDLARIVFWIDTNGHPDGVAVPDPETSRSPFELDEG